MSRFILPTKRKQPDLVALRRTLITAMWIDYKLFGYTTQTVWALQKRIVKAKQAQKIIQFPADREEKRAA